MISLTKHNELKGYKSLEAYPEVAHFVTTRHEGISTGAYGSFNCSGYDRKRRRDGLRTNSGGNPRLKWRLVIAGSVPAGVATPAGTLSGTYRKTRLL